MLKEIGSTLRGTYVNNIFTAGASQVFRFRKAGSEDVWLMVSPKKGVWISERVNERAGTKEFTSKLRGELERAKFAGASQADLDRVFQLHFEGERARTMVVELMPPGNIIVTDPDGRIVLAEEEVRSRSRRVARGEVYHPPAQTRVSPSAVNAAEVKAMVAQERTAGAAIGRHIGLPRKYVSVLLTQLGLEDESASSQLLGREEELVGKIHALLREATESPSPCIAATPRGDEVFATVPTGLEVRESAPSLSQICDQLFLEEAVSGVEAQPAEDAKRKELEVTISRLRTESESLLQEASRARDMAKEAVGGTVEEALAILRGSGTPESRLPSSPAAIASALFDHAKKLERKSAESLAAMSRLERRKAKSVPRVVRRTIPLSKRKPEWFEKFRWFLTSEGRLAVGGRDAQSNTLLIKRHLEDGDSVYHADLFGSPFFVLKGGRQQSELETLEVSQATVSFSSGWKTGLGAADAYWVYKDQVSGSAESGEYLAKGSFVIRGRKNFVRHALLHVAVGLDEAGRVMAGPESAVSKACVRYVVLVPHREKASETAKKVQKILTGAEQASPPQLLDEILRALPSGGGKVVRSKIRSPPSG